MSDLTETEKKAFSVLAVCGNVTYKQYLSVCYTVGVDVDDESVVEVLRTEGFINKHSVREIGEIYGHFVALDGKGDIAVREVESSPIIRVNTHPLINTDDG